ncbi:MAG: D-threonine aldolase [Steroidobacteraceae bacterium]|nr:D-threonine aldolase [Steroidobacteraceae bacterium]
MIEKGFPRFVSREEIPARGWNVLREDLPTPVAVLRQSALDNNARWLRAFTASLGVDLAPHGKTTMSPELFARQIESGCWGLTCATAHHLEVYRAAGVRRVLFANQVIGRANVRSVLAHLSDEAFELYVLVDGIEGATALAQGAQALGLRRPVPVLIEIGAAGQRTGVRSVEQGVELARLVSAQPRLALRGVETFEGLYGHAPTEQGLAGVEALLRSCVELAEAIDAGDSFAPGEVLLSAGGSDFFDVAALRLKAARLSRPVRVVLRTGCTITLDHMHCRAAFERIRQRDANAVLPQGSLQPALEVWGHVQSAPEPGRLICNVGKRDVSYDWKLPAPVWWSSASKLKSMPPGHATSALNDQHLYLDSPPDSPLRVGDMVGFGVSHPCTTFDKWRLLALVNDDYDVVETVTTAF